MQEKKEFLRQEALKSRAQIQESDDPQAVVDLFFQAIAPTPDLSIAFYVPMHKEFDCWHLLEAAEDRGHDCALPVIQKGNKELLFAKWGQGQALEKGPYKIPQPVLDGAEYIQPDIIIAPLLAFDRRGYRLGMGGGYYDATLKMLRENKPELLAIGVAHAQQACIFNLPVEEHDEKLDWVITPQGTHYFGE